MALIDDPLCVLYMYHQVLLGKERKSIKTIHVNLSAIQKQIMSNEAVWKLE